MERSAWRDRPGEIGLEGRWSILIFYFIFKILMFCLRPCLAKFFAKRAVLVTINTFIMTVSVTYICAPKINNIPPSFELKTRKTKKVSNDHSRHRTWDHLIRSQMLIHWATGPLQLIAIYKSLFIF